MLNYAFEQTVVDIILKENDITRVCVCVQFDSSMKRAYMTTFGFHYMKAHAITTTMATMKTSTRAECSVSVSTPTVIATHTQAHSTPYIEQ